MSSTWTWLLVAALFTAEVAAEFWVREYLPRPTHVGRPPADWPQCPPPPARCEPIEGNLNISNSYYKYIVDGMSLPLFRTEDSITLQCIEGVSLHSPSLPCFSRNMTIPSVRLKYCNVPSDSYSTRLAQLNITVSRDLFLNVYFKQETSFSQVQFKGLRIKYFKLEHEIKVKKAFLADDWMEPLTELTRVDLIGVSLPPMPSTNKIEHVTLRVSFIRGAWGGCSHLREVSLDNIKWERGKEPVRWLAHCRRLEVLRLNNIFLFKRLMTVFGGLPPLRVLNIVSCLLGFNDGDTLKMLVREIFEPSAATLQELLLPGNSLGDICEESKSGVQKVPLRLSALQRLSLARADVKRICPSWPQDMPALVHLDLDKNSLEPIQYRDLQWLGSRQSHLILSKVDLIMYNRSQYLEVVRGNCTKLGVEITFSGWLNCDCKLYWFARTLSACPGHVRWPREPTCMRVHTELPQMPPAAMLCPLEPDAAQQVRCPAGCRCYWRDQYPVSVVANCTDAGLGRMPRIAGLLTLHASHNHIDTIDTDDVAETLTYVDLRHNNVSRVAAPAAGALLAARRRVLLGDNPLRCDCENQPLLQALWRHQEQVDYRDLKCEDGKLLTTIIVDDLCKLSSSQLLTYTLTPGMIILSVVLVASWFMYYYRKEVRVFLYARDLCQCCIREEDLDYDREYDAFVSYSHLDEEFVYRQLVPELEGAPRAFKLCIHTRDWLIGEWVPAQIIRSVEKSRRTIIIMSRNFLLSVWGLMEFRTAHLTAMRDGRARVIVVLLEEVGELPELDEELKAYLSTNTYLKWGDPRFFDKLRYALPHRRLEREERRAGVQIVETSQVIPNFPRAPNALLALPAPEMLCLEPINNTNLQ
ncbi:protein toll-like [Aphomia sociella]